jgi:hypothetical protein
VAIKLKAVVQFDQAVTYVDISAGKGKRMGEGALCLFPQPGYEAK